MIPRMPRWQSYVATTTEPIFTPEQCKMIIDAGHSCAPEKAKVGGGKNGEYDNKYVWVFKMKDGLIHSIREYNSDILVATQLYDYKLIKEEE